MKKVCHFWSAISSSAFVFVDAAAVSVDCLRLTTSWNVRFVIAGNESDLCGLITTWHTEVLINVVILFALNARSMPVQQHLLENCRMHKQ